MFSDEINNDKTKCLVEIFIGQRTIGGHVNCFILLILQIRV